MDNAPPPNPSQFAPAKSTFVASSSTYTAARASVASFVLVSRPRASRRRRRVPRESSPRTCSIVRDVPSPSARAPLASSPIPPRFRQSFPSSSRAVPFESSFVASRRFRDTKRRSVPSFASFAPSRTPRRPRRARAPRRASFVVASLSRRVASFRRSPSSRCVVHHPSVIHSLSFIRPGRASSMSTDRPTDRRCDAMR